MNIKNFFLEIVETVVTSSIVLIVLYATIAMPELVWGSSMEPTFETGERILVDRVTKLINSNFQRGEIVVFNPEGSSKHLIKRIIGVPGDVFKIYECKVYVSRDDGRFVLSEYYLAGGVCTKGGSQILEGRSFKINEDEYVALGDNREVSLDSRNIGLVSKDEVVGRVVFRFWPLSRMGFVR